MAEEFPRPKGQEYMKGFVGEIKARATRFILKLLMRLHNFCYSNISWLAPIAEGGIHPKHRLTNYHQFFIDNISNGDTVLDIGCGNGFLTSDIAKKAGNVTAIDMSERNIEIARRDFSRDNIDYICGDVTEFNFEKGYNVITLSNLLEHIANRQDFLARIRGLADKFLIRAPMVNRDWLTYYKRESGIEYRLDPTHKIEYTLESFAQELAEAGMKIEKASLQFGEIWAVVLEST
jgi:2-polyprenyl-3-methyl-5-hydroxy-6-metoxy-1,4-benzoquinol methylase